MSFLTLDLETVPQARFTNDQSWPPLDADYLNEDRGADRVGYEVAAGRAVLAATKQPAALHASTCHVVQVSLGWRAPMGNHAAELHRKVIQADDYAPDGSLPDVANAERALLSEALDILASACGKRTTIVSFNGKSFDVPVLRGRAALLGLRVPTIPWRRLLYPFDDNQHADLRLILSNDDRRARGTLQWWAEAFGIYAEEHGAEVFSWVQAGEWAQLRDYGACEAQTLVELYERVQPIL